MCYGKLIILFFNLCRALIDWSVHLARQACVPCAVTPTFRLRCCRIAHERNNRSIAQQYLPIAHAQSCAIGSFGAACQDCCTAIIGCCLNTCAWDKWTFRWHANSRIDDSQTRQFADLTIRGLANSRTVDESRKDGSRTSRTIRGQTEVTAETLFARAEIVKSRTNLN